MSLFKDMKSTGMEAATDRLGGFQAQETDIYQATIKNLYVTESSKGAMAVTLIADLGGDKEYRETFYISSGREKGQKNYYEKNGKKYPLPGFTVVNDLCLIATEKELCELEPEEKVVKIYDPEAKEEVNKSVPVITEALGKKVALGILKQLENKNEKDANDNYVATAETKETNVVDKVFHPDLKVTVSEARKGEEATFWDAWLKRNQGQTRDRREIKDGESAPKGKPGTPPKAGGAAAAPRKSLFGGK